MQVLTTEMVKEHWKGNVPNQEMSPIRIGARVRKTNSQPGDSHTDGATGTFVMYLGDAKVLGLENDDWGGIVEWDDMPNFACGIMGSRIELLSE